MGGIIGAWPLRSTSVVRVVKAVLLGSGDVLNQIVSRLVCHIRVLLEEDRVLRNLVGNLVVWVLRVFNAEGQVMGCSTLWWGFRVAVTMMGGRPVGARVVWSQRHVGMGGEGNGHWDHYRQDLKTNQAMLVKGAKYSQKVCSF